MNRYRIHSAALLIICIAIPLIAGLIGSLFTTAAIPTWYVSLNKPSFNPPNWIFGPVWTTLYILMGISLYLIVRKGLETPHVRQGVAIFAIQLVVNVVWSIVFFGMHAPVSALAVIFLLLALLIGTIVVFYRISHAAAWLLVPYVIWCCFATILNATIILLN
jgi:translocator protein